MSDLLLHESLALAAECLRGNAAVLAAAGAADPLRLDLSPLRDGSRDASITASSVRSLAALYLQANLEDAGIVAVAELLGQSRNQFRTLTADAARKLDPFTRPPSDVYSRPQREAIFARVFGLGGAPQGSPANYEFERLLAALCVALLRCEVELRLSANVGAERDAALRYAASALLFNLAPRQYGNTLTAVPVIDRQLRQAIAVLSDHTILAQFGARDLWDAIRIVAGDAAPDLNRLVARGRTGLQLLQWLAGVLGIVNDARTPVVARGDGVFLAAAQWLQATGIELPASGAIAAQPPAEARA